MVHRSGWWTVRCPNGSGCEASSRCSCASTSTTSSTPSTCSSATTISTAPRSDGSPMSTRRPAERMSPSTSASDRATRVRHWLIVTVLTLLASGPIVHVQAPATPPADQYRALDQALARLKSSGSVETKDLEQRLVELRNTRGGPCRLDILCTRL